MSKLVYLWESILLLMQESENGTTTPGGKSRRRTTTAGNNPFACTIPGGAKPCACRQPNLPKLRYR
jgi:hypothetical protein